MFILAVICKICFAKYQLSTSSLKTEGIRSFYALNDFDMTICC
jgi:hypothetical protein